jgi:hypothetical protein
MDQDYFYYAINARADYEIFLLIPEQERVQSAKFDARMCGMHSSSVLGINEVPVLLARHEVLAKNWREGWLDSRLWEARSIFESSMMPNADPALLETAYTASFECGRIGFGLNVEGTPFMLVGNAALADGWNDGRKKAAEDYAQYCQSLDVRLSMGAEHPITINQAD